MAAVSTLAAVAIGVGVASTAFSVVQGRQAAKAQKRASEVQRRQREAEEARARRAQISEARRRRASLVAGAAAGGVTESSGALAGTGQLQAQSGERLGFMARSSARAREFEMFADRAGDRQNRAAIGQQVAGLSFQAASLFSSPSFSGQSQTPQSSGFVPADTPGPRSIFGSR